MSDYIRSLTSVIKSRLLKEKVSAELDDHIKTKAQTYIGRGFDDASALEKANADMGENAVETGEKLASVNRRFSVADLFIYLLYLMLFAFEVMGRYVQFICEQDTFMWESSELMDTQPPYALFNIMIELAILTYQLAFVVLSVRRRYIVIPFLSAVSFAASARFNLSVTVFITELFTGGIQRYIPDVSYYKIFCNDNKIIIINSVFYSSMFTAAIIAAVLGIKYRSGSIRKTDLSHRKSLCAFMSVFLAINILAVAVQKTGEKIYIDAHPMTTATNVGVLACEEKPDADAEELLKQFSFYDIWSVDFDIKTLNDNWRREYQNSTVAEGLTKRDAFISVFGEKRYYEPAAHKYYLVSYCRHDGINMECVKTELIEATPGEEINIEWRSPGGKAYFVNIKNGT